MTGAFISIEGPEASGKTTQARRLVARCEALGLQVTLVREPGGSKTGDAIREVVQFNRAGEALHAKTEALLFAASRAQMVTYSVLPALEQGGVVISDRYVDTTLAYQGYGRQIDVSVIREINTFATGGLMPGLTILLDLDIEKVFSRLSRREAAQGTGFDRIESEPRDFHERVRQGFLTLAEENPDRFLVLHGDAPEDTLHELIWARA